MKDPKHIMEKRARLSVAQRTLLEERLRRKASRKGHTDQQETIVQVAQGSTFLSSAQQRLWFLDQMDSGKSVYNEFVAFQIDGELDIQALDLSLREIVYRHDILRATIRSRDEIPFIVVASLPESVLTLIDLRGMSDFRQDLHAMQCMKSEAIQPFVLETGPLFRLGLFLLSQKKYLLAINMHHIICDAWSGGIFVQELEVLYQAFTCDNPSPLSKLPLQYIDYVRAQEQRLRDGSLDAQRAYWQRQLRDVPIKLLLPTDHPRPDEQCFRGATQQFSISPSMTNQLKSISQQEGTTLFMTLLAALQVLLYRYTGQKDIVIGSPIAGRNSVQVETLIGLFINILPLRVNFIGNPSFALVLRQIREVTLGAFSHQDFPFEKIVEMLQPERNLSYTPLCQVLLSHYNSELPILTLRLPAVTVRPFHVGRDITRFDLNFVTWEVDGQIKGTLEYSTDLFEAGTIERLLGHLQIVLEAIVADPSQRVGSLCLLSDAERQHLLVEWKSTTTPYPHERCLHELIEDQVQCSPDALALLDGEEQMSYAALNRRVTELAGVLQAHGVGPEVLVGVYLPRCLGLPVALLAVLKAGGAYVPIDPSYPAHRRLLLLQESGVKLLITQHALCASLESEGKTLLCLEDLSKGDTEEPIMSLVCPQNVAYVLYTSGSTGRPKGVMVTHQALVNYVCWAVGNYQVAQGGGSPWHTSAGFDLTITSLFPALVAGKPVWVVPESNDLDLLRQMLQQTSFSPVKLTPTHVRALQYQMADHTVERMWPAHTLVIGGEALYGDHLMSLRHQVPGSRFINEYGPTEATVGCCRYEVPSDFPAQGAVPIGGPIANTRLYVLDEHLQMVPPGVPGELYIAGDGMARGYAQAPVLTAERFLPDPSRWQSGARMYKTGDLVRYLPDGNLEYLGRLDEQVKLRGFRIEPREIALVLQQAEGVREAVVIVREDHPGEKRLVAYVVPEPEHPVPSPLALRGFLQERMPDYMVPHSIVLLAELPITEHGKLHREALPVPDGSRTAQDPVLTQPRLAGEQTLAMVWSQVLGVQPIGIYDNFFALGGDSILCMQVVARARQHGLHLSVRQMFQHQTIASLAVVTQPVCQPQEQEDLTDPFPLLPIAHWFLSQHFRVPQHWNQALLLEVAELLHGGLLTQSLAEVLIHHDMLRLRLRASEQGWQPEIAPVQECPLPLWWIDLRGLEPAQQAMEQAIWIAVAHRSLDFQEGPLLRGVVFLLGETQGQRMLLVAHHLVIDGVSWRILLEDLQTCYRLRGQLPAKTTSYAQWGRRLTALLKQGAFEQERSYWQAVVDRCVGKLPVDYVRGDNSEASARTLRRELSSEETTALLREVPQQIHTQMQEVLLAALWWSVSQWTGSSKVWLEVEGHGREEVEEGVEVSRTVGWFTSLYPVVLQVEERQWSGVLKQVKEYLRGVPRRGIGYGVLRYLHEEQEVRGCLRWQEEGQLLFNYLGQFDQSVAGDLGWKLAEAGSGRGHDEAEQRTHVVELNCGVSGGRLWMDWTYSEHLHREETIARVAQGMQEALRAIIRLSQAKEIGAFTPSDFPLAHLEQETLDQWKEHGYDIEDVYALSSIQHGLLFHALHDMQSRAYLVQMVFSLQGNLDRNVLADVWSHMVERHSILRTSFVWDGLDEPLQLVHRKMMLPWYYQDCRNLTPLEQQDVLNAYLQSDRAKGFDLREVPLIRLALLQLKEDSYSLIWSYPHLLTDGWSLAALSSEIVRVYRSRMRGEEVLLEPAGCYRDYILWLNTQDKEKAEVFWRQTLKGFTIPTPFPVTRTVKGSVSSKTGEYGQAFCEVNSDVTAALRLLTRQYHITLNTSIQAAWALLLSKYTGQRDIVFGATVAGRPPELKNAESIIGPLINTLPVRIHVAEQARLLDWLEDVQLHLVDIQQYSYCPLASIQQWSEIAQGTPLFESILILENYPVDSSFLQTDDVLTVCDFYDIEWTHYPLTLLIEPTRHLRLRAIYDSNLYREDEIQCMLGYLRTLLEHITLDPHQQVQNLSLLSQLETEQLLRTWNATCIIPEQDMCIHALFENRAASCPDAIALVSDEEHLTYEMVNQRANHLTHSLIARGVKRGELIGICIEALEEMIVGMLGVLKAGGAYIPLEPRHPQYRNNRILWETQATIVVTTRKWLTLFPEYKGTRIILDQNAESLEGTGKYTIQIDVIPEDSACVLYSAGQYITLGHRELCSNIHWLQQCFPLSHTDTLLSDGLLTMENANWEIFWPLFSGSRLLMISAENKRSYYQQALIEYQTSILFTLPSSLPGISQLLQELGQSQSLRLVLCSREMLPYAVSRDFAQSFTGQFHYLSGLPETGYYLSTNMADGGDGNGIVCAGSTTHMSIYILDANMQPVPTGIPGDVYVTSGSLAHGYLHDTEATNRSFIYTQITSPEPAYIRLFKTGQIGYYLGNSRFELKEMSNRTAWVKGYQVSLDEIQALLLTDPTVDDCFVTLQKSQTGFYTVVAYIVPIGVFVPDRQKKYLEDFLPQPLLPERYIPVSSLTILPTGQIDEQSLIAIKEVDEEAIHYWRSQLQAIHGVDQVVVVSQKYVGHTSRLHLQDLLPACHTDFNDNNVLLDTVSTQMEEIITSEEVMAFSDGGSLFIDADAPKTLVEALLRTANIYQDKGITYLLPDGLSLFQSYPDLLLEARCILTGLIRNGLTPHDKVILQIEDLQDHFATFWACVLGGIVPVTVAVASTYKGKNSIVNKLYNIWSLLEHPYILASDKLVEPLSCLKTTFAIENLAVLSIQSLRTDVPCEDLYQSVPEDVVFFQLTSGSTGVPKCIQETHKGIIAHISASQQFNYYDTDDVSFNWLPMDHVVPILTYHLKDVYLGCQQIEARPDFVLANPLNWFNVIEKYKVTHSWSPNFGYKLVSDCLKKELHKTWDLSSIKFFMNAGEQVTLPVVQEFLQLVAPFHVAPHAMQPAFGMAEACTCMTYQNAFTVESGVHRFTKSSLNGKLQKAAATDVTAISFIDLGPVVPGVQIRIVDSNNQLLPEGVIGRFQIKGDVITPGYYKNEAANREAFVGDGWFNSGDLGFILHGRLTLTGREKEMIIINGSNYYCYEIEDVVNGIAGVEPTYVGACAIDEVHSGTEGLAIFFVSSATSLEDTVNLIKTIRNHVNANIGINPLYIVPLAKEDFPKTTSGKIQRTQMKKSLQAGVYQDILKTIDIHLENTKTLPDWFYQKIWLRRDAEYLVPLSTIGCVLVFLDQEGLGEYLCMQLREYGRHVICIQASEHFVQLGDGCYTIDPKNPEHYKLVLKDIFTQNIYITHIFHLWSYYLPVANLSHANALMQLQEKSLYSLLFLIRALAQIKTADHALTLFVVTNNAQAVTKTEKSAIEKAPMLGLVKTASQELPWLRCCSIDMPIDQEKTNVRYLLQELYSSQGDDVVAFRNDQRWIQCLARVDWLQERRQSSCFVTQGFYLLSGGLGGIGVKIAQHLLIDYGAKVLIVGRTLLPERTTWETPQRYSATVAACIENYLTLERAGDIMYATADVCDMERMKEVVEQAANHWGRDLDGVLHLAGAFHERFLVEEDEESVDEVIRPKIFGTWILHQLVKDRPDSLFITFSSVNGFFGGNMVAAYAAANSFLDMFVHYQRMQSKLRSYSIAWSSWDGIGINRNNQMREFSHQRGFLPITDQQGWYSLLTILSHDKEQIFVGLDADKQFIQRVSHVTTNPLQKLIAYYTMKEQGNLIQRLREKIQTPLPKNYDFVQLETMPLTTSGEIDVHKIAAEHSVDQRQEEVVAPRCELEQQLLVIWQDILKQPSLSIFSNFFSQGGHSLLATQLISRVHKVLKLDVPLRWLFEAPNVAEFGKLLEEQLRISQPAQLPALLPVARETALPLSFAQQRLWFLTQLHPEDYSYNIQAPFRLQGILHTQVLEQSLNEIVRRHEVLRTRFVVVEGLPQQIITSTTPFVTMPVIDIGSLPPHQQNIAVSQINRVDIQCPFDLAQGPLLRVALLRFSDTEHVLLLTTHHIAFDGWSVGVFNHELALLYNRFLHGKPSPLAQLPIQYADFAVWQRQWLASGVQEKQLTYWQKQLQNVPELILPTDHPRSSNPSSSGSIYPFKVPEIVVIALQTLCMDEEVTLFMVLLAAFQTLLYGLTQQEDFVVGTDIANRNHSETEGLIGFFVNILLLRADMRDRSSFRHVLKRVREVVLDAYTNQDVPLDKVIEVLRIERQGYQLPLLQTLFVLQNTPHQALEMEGLDISLMENVVTTTRFDIAMFIEEGSDGLVGNLTYRTELFDSTTIATIVSCFNQLLQTIAVDPDKYLDELEFLNRTGKKPVSTIEKEKRMNNSRNTKLPTRRGINLSQGALIKTSSLEDSQTLPLVIQPAISDVNLANWALANKGFIESAIQKHGALLFRGFHTETAASFESFAHANSPDLFGDYGDLPREDAGDKIYTSTPYPADQPILFHNESSHMHQWPMKIWFYCAIPAQQGGATPIVDCRSVSQLIEPAILKRFKEKKLMYVRNFIPGLDVSWQSFFQTTDREAVAAICRKTATRCIWMGENTLRTERICQAVTTHPKTGEEIFFNQVQLYHISCLEPTVREAMLSMLELEKLPRNVYYGDGSPIEDSVMQEISEVYKQAAIRFTWQKGDILMLDNMLVAHARDPFVGNERKILVAMADVISGNSNN